MSNTAHAWLLEWPLQALALAQCEVVEIVEEPEVHAVPCGPSWCRALLYWRDQMLPLALPAGSSANTSKIVVVAYQRAPREALRYAAIAVTGMPRQIEVTASMDCEPLVTCPLDESVVRACFEFENRVVVVPELQAWFEPAQKAA